MPTDLNHEQHRWSYMTTEQLLTRLHRITRPAKLLNFWECCHASQFAARHDMERLRLACIGRSNQLLITLPVRTRVDDPERVPYSGRPIQVVDLQAVDLQAVGDLPLDEGDVDDVPTIPANGALADHDGKPPLAKKRMRKRQPEVKPPVRKKGMRVIRMRRTKPDEGIDASIEDLLNLKGIDDEL